MENSQQRGRTIEVLNQAGKQNENKNIFIKLCPLFLTRTNLLQQQEEKSSFYQVNEMLIVDSAE